MPSDSIAFDRAASYYDATRGFPANEQQAIATMLAQAAGFGGQTRLLEIGIGTGRIALPLAPHVQEIIGIDLARPMMKRLREKQSNEAIRLVQADATQLPFADASFDGLVAVHVFHLIPRWRDALREVIRVLKPDAPIVYARNRKADESAFKPLTDVSDTIITPATRHIGVQMDEDNRFLLDQGWTRKGERQMHPFTIQRTPRQIVEASEKRIWSGSWRLTEEKHQRLLEGLRRVMAEHYPDPDQEFEIETGFEVDVFLPPQS
jgi:ubiquinone/menaquinone biosynthesis C-methylase UbiE